MYRQFYLSHYQKATKDFYITFIREPVEALQPHTHDYYQLYFVVSGELGHFLGENTGSLGPGDVFLIPPNIPHYIAKETEDTAFYAVSFTAGFFTQSGNAILTDFLKYLAEIPAGRVFPSFSLNQEDRELVESLVQRCFWEFTQKQAGSGELIRQALSTAITLIARNYYQVAPTGVSTGFRTARQWVMDSILYVNEHFAENITLEGILQSCGLSRGRFCKLFFSLTGMTFNQYLHANRIERARQLIFEGNKITTVSQLCGYQDFSTFYRNFKKITGISPADYKAEEMSHSR